MNRRQFIAATASATAVTAWSLPGQSAPPARRLRVAIIGHTGRGNYGHGLDKVWLMLPEIEIVGVADADEKGLAVAQGRLKTKGFTDYRRMLAEVKPDLVAIAPRFVDEHHAMAMAAITGGARGIYVEKPLCRTLVEADELVAACAKHRCKCAVAHRNRYNPTLPVLERLVREGVIGRLLEIRGRGKEDKRGGGEDLWVLGSHVLNVSVVFTGKPVTGSATLLAKGRLATKADLTDGSDAVGPVAGDALHARFETERGIPIYFDSVANAGTKDSGFGLQLIGTEGVIDLRLDQHPIAHLLAGSPFVPAAKPRAWVPITTAGIGQPEPLADITQLVRDHLLPAWDLVGAVNSDRQPLCNEQDGRLTVEMVMAIFESHRLKGQRVAFPLVTRRHPLELPFT